MNLIFQLVALIALIALIVFLVWSLIKNQKLQKQLQKNLEEDLELATSEQLMNELRKRPEYPYVILFPLKSENYHGFSIEIHGMPPTVALMTLRMAGVILVKEFIDRGIEIPEMEVGDTDTPPEFPGDIFNDN